jgi:hypothetical protein
MVQRIGEATCIWVDFFVVVELFFLSLLFAI